MLTVILSVLRFVVAELNGVVTLSIVVTKFVCAHFLVHNFFWECQNLFVPYHQFNFVFFFVIVMFCLAKFCL